MRGQRGAVLQHRAGQASTACGGDGQVARARRVRHTARDRRDHVDRVDDRDDEGGVVRPLATVVVGRVALGKGEEAWLRLGLELGTGSGLGLGLGLELGLGLGLGLIFQARGVRRALEAYALR